MFRILLMIFQFCQMHKSLAALFFFAEMGPTYVTAGLTYKEVNPDGVLRWPVSNPWFRTCPQQAILWISGGYPKSLPGPWPFSYTHGDLGDINGYHISF
jgi:hypothetical protein